MACCLLAQSALLLNEYSNTIFSVIWTTSSTFVMDQNAFEKYCLQNVGHFVQASMWQLLKIQPVPTPILTYCQLGPWKQTWKQNKQIRTKISDVICEGCLSKPQGVKLKPTNRTRIVWEWNTRRQGVKLRPTHNTRIVQSGVPRGISLHLPSSSNKISWYLIFVEIVILAPCYDLCQKLDDGSASWMRSRHLISDTNYTMDIDHHLRNYNLTKTFWWAHQV